METKEQPNSKATIALQKIQEILKDFDCTLKADILVTEKGNFPRIFVIENPKETQDVAPTNTSIPK